MKKETTVCQWVWYEFIQTWGMINFCENPLCGCRMPALPGAYDGERQPREGSFPVPDVILEVPSHA